MVIGLPTKRSFRYLDFTNDLMVLGINEARQQ